VEGAIRVVDDPLQVVVADAVIRPVRTDLSPVTAVSRDLLSAAGEVVERRLSELGSLPLGGAVLTPAGGLPASFLIHVVVMSEDEPQTSATVRKAVENGLRRATDWELSSLALPPLGIGVGMTEPEVAAQELVELLGSHLERGRPPLELIIAATSPYETELFMGLVEKMCRDDAAGD